MPTERSPGSPGMGMVNPSTPGPHAQMHTQQARPPTNASPGGPGGPSSCSSQGQLHLGSRKRLWGVGLCGGPRIFLRTRILDGAEESNLKKASFACERAENSPRLFLSTWGGEKKNSLRNVVILGPRCVIIELKTLIFCPTHYSYMPFG